MSDLSLSRLWSYRKQLEEALRIELAELDRAHQIMASRLRRLEKTAEEEVHSYLARAQAGLTADELAGRYAALETQAATTQSVERIVAETDGRRNRKMLDVLEASRERKKLEILERRLAVQRKRAAERREQRDLDEAAARRFLSGRDP
jgi:flagellar export protein FliJ